MTIESHVICTMSAPCKTCARYVEPVHVVRELTRDRYTAVSQPHLFCGECCVVCQEKAVRARMTP